MTTEKGKRSNYTEDFKRDAVALVTEQGYKISEAARSLDVGAAVIDAGDNQIGAQYLEKSNTALQLAATAGKASRSDEMALKVVEARLEVEVREMMKEIDNDSANISLLYSAHMERCIWVMNNTNALLEDWTTRILNRE